jgi:hypothetical protein
MELTEFAQASHLSKLSQPEQVLHLGWFVHIHRGRTRFDQAAIRTCFEELHMDAPNLSLLFARLLERRPKVLLKDGAGCYVEHKTRSKLDEKYGDHETTLAVSALLRSLPGKIADEAERLFLKEAITCYHHRAFRAAIIMAWNLTYDHMARWILADPKRLAAFNSQIAARVGLTSKRAGITISKREEFEQLEEKEMIDVMAKASLLPSANTKKILEMQLTRRNMVAHPSLVITDAPQADDAITSLVQNVVLVMK